MTRTQGPQSADDPAIPSPPDQSKARLDSTRSAVRRAVLLDSLLVTSCVLAFVIGRLGMSWWYLLGYAPACAAVLISRVRAARRLAHEVELARAIPRPLRFPGHFMADALEAAAPKINAAMRNATTEMIKNIEARRVTHGDPPGGRLLTRPLWTGTFLGGPLDGTDATLLADLNGVPPVVHTHSEWTTPRPLTYECLTHYKLIDLDPKRRRANYEYQRDGFTVTAERYEQLRRAVQGEQR